MAVTKTEAPPAAAKAESAHAAKADATAKAEGSEASVAAAPAKPSPLFAWLPVLASVLLAPVATWAAVELIVLPRLQKKIASTPVPAVAPALESPAGKDGKFGKDGGDAAVTYEFKDVVVNLAGTMGTRYLKTSFLVTGVDSGIKAAFDGAKPRLTDVTLNILSSLTLADLEEPGAKNVILAKLVAAYNQALGKKVAEQVYFSDFVVQ